MPEPSAFEFELDIEKLKGHKSPGSDQIPAELIKADCRIIRYKIHKLISSISDNEELPEECKVSTIVSIFKMGDKTYSSNYRGIWLCQLSTKFYPTSCAVNVNSLCRGNYLGSTMWISTQQVNY